MNKIAVLIPCYNEELTIQYVISNVKRYLPSAEIYVYDNNSTDKTIAKAKEFGVSIGNVSQRGKGNVVRAMFNEIEANCYIMVDGDNTYDLKNIKEMSDLILSNKASMVIGKRTFLNSSLTSKLSNKFLRYLVKCLYRTDLPDVLTGFRAFNRDFVKNFPSMYDGFEVETEMVSYALANKARLGYVDTDYSDRPKGSHSKIKLLRDGSKILIAMFSLYLKDKNKR